MADRPLSALTSLTLLRRAQQGEREALEELFARYVPFLRRLARGRVPKWARAGAETADLVQETLLQTFRRIEHFEPRGNGAMRAYLRQALQNRISNSRRNAMRKPTDPIEELDVPVDGPSPLDEFLSGEERDRYQRALDSLRPDDRKAILGRFELGYSYEQLAEVLGKPSPDAARVAVRRAVTRLAEAMNA